MLLGINSTGKCVRLSSRPGLFLQLLATRGCLQYSAASVREKSISEEHVCFFLMTDLLVCLALR